MKNSSSYSLYHNSFEGDTYDACARCGGKCEKYKISTLMPGEKEYMAKKLDISIDALEKKYLSKINTPFGILDVLKMKDGCNFLDKDYKCTAIPAKPILCDSYPIVFYIENNSVKFEIDKLDCPMVHWKEYKNAIDVFENQCIRLLKKLKIPLTWWKTVALFDEFDVDYVAIDKDLSKTRGYDEFYLEMILGYACNGYENKARKRGLNLLVERYLRLEKKMIFKFNNFSKEKSGRTKQLTNVYKKSFKEYSSYIVSNVKQQKTNNQLLVNSSPSEYVEIIEQGFRSLNYLRNISETYLKRLRKIDTLLKDKKQSKSVLTKIEKILPEFKTAIKRKIPNVSFFEISDSNSRDFWDSLNILSQTFFPNEIDSPN